METLALDVIISNSLPNSISYQEYSDLLRKYADEGLTTGPNQNEDLIHYTKLNVQRGKRISKTVQLLPELVKKISEIDQKQTWLLITESWCGDAANSVPVMAKLAEINDSTDLRIVLRDENLELMDQFLTRGGRSIPKLIVLNADNQVQFAWGPRPEPAQELYDAWKNSDDDVPYKEFQVELQKWYNQDGGSSLQTELLKLFLR